LLLQSAVFVNYRLVFSHFETRQSLV